MVPVLLIRFLKGVIFNFFMVGELWFLTKLFNISCYIFSPILFFVTSKSKHNNGYKIIFIVGSLYFLSLGMSTWLSGTPTMGSIFVRLCRTSLLDPGRHNCAQYQEYLPVWTSPRCCFIILLRRFTLISIIFKVFFYLWKSAPYKAKRDELEKPFIFFGFFS